MLKEQEEKLAVLEFTLVDAYGNETRLVKKFNQKVIEEVEGTFPYIVEKFQDFLKAAEFYDETVNSITYKL